MKSYISDKIVIKESPIQGVGMFAIRKINKGEVVFIKGGHILKRDEFFSNGTINSYMPIDDDYFLAARNAEEEKDIKLFNNHSCEPNCGLRGEITFVAINDIEPNEELTCDYAFIDNEDYKFNCNCGASSCRKIITGLDWKIKRLQERYGEYFAVYLQKKFRK